jgi:hypothetical protein
VCVDYVNSHIGPLNSHKGAAGLPMTHARTICPKCEKRPSHSPMALHDILLRIRYTLF